MKKPRLLKYLSSFKFIFIFVFLLLYFSDRLNLYNYFLVISLFIFPYELYKVIFTYNVLSITLKGDFFYLVYIKGFNRNEERFSIDEISIAIVKKSGPRGIPYRVYRIEKKGSHIIAEIHPEASGWSESSLDELIDEVEFQAGAREK